MFLKSGKEGGARWESLAFAASRALALFFGGFSLLNLAGNLRFHSFDANLWWIDLRAFPEIPATILLIATSLFLVAFAIHPPRSLWRRAATAGSAALLAAIAFWNVLEFYSLLFQGRVHSRLPVALSLIVACALALIVFVNVRSNQNRIVSRNPLPALAIFALLLAAFPIAEMLCFGETDYRRPADVAVVFGARTYKDGRPSDALADRVRTACQLYRNGLVKKLIFSGGPGDGAVTEAEAMRRFALKLGVNPADILADNAGLNTQDTVKNTATLFSELGARKILVVSHFYHLPRIKMAYQRAGWDVYTVPAKESYFLRQMPFFVAREVAATWVYYLRPLVAKI